MGLIIRLERLRALSGAFFWSEGEKTEGTRGQRGDSPLAHSQLHVVIKVHFNNFLFLFGLFEII